MVCVNWYEETHVESDFGFQPQRMSGGVGSEETSSGSQNVMSEEERLKKRAARFGVANETPPKQQDEAMEGTKDGPAPVGTDAKSEKKQDGGGGDDASGGADHDAATGKKRSRLSGRLGVITDEVQQEKKPREEMDLDKLLESEEAKLMQELGVTARTQTQLEHKVVSRLEQAAEQREKEEQDARAKKEEEKRQSQITMLRSNVQNIEKKTQGPRLLLRCAAGSAPKADARRTR